MKTFTLGLMLGGFAHGQLQLSPQATKPDHAITAPPDFVGFEVESVFFDLFNNEFSRNMVNSLAARMSKPPVIRVGGTSGDYLVFNPQQSEDKVCIGSTCPANNDKYIIGPTFFKAYSNFPQARMTIQAPLNNPVNNTNTLDFVTRAWSQLENGKQVAAIALGNEPGFIYKSAQAYAVAAIELQQQIMSALNLTGSAARIFEAGNIATSAAADHTSYQVYASPFLSYPLDLSEFLTGLLIQGQYSQSRHRQHQLDLEHSGALVPDSDQDEVYRREFTEYDAAICASFMSTRRLTLSQG